MKKIAFFVEGLTEQMFVEQLLLEAANAHDIVIEKRKAFGGGASCFPRRLRLIEAVKPTTDAKYYALIVDCATDSRVKSDIRERYDGLCRANFSSVVGLRDVYPNTRDQIPRLRRNLGYGIPTRPIPVAIILAIMEIEAWFLAEQSHFARIAPQLTSQAVQTTLGFDPATYDVELRNHPSQDLDAVYRVANYRYIKTRNSIQRTVTSLDYADLYLNVCRRLQSLQDLLNQIDSFLN